MSEIADGAPFSSDDLARLSRKSLDAWQTGVDLDWSVPAGTLEWTCRATAEHTVDCVFSYALFLASRREDSYPPFDELHALPEATPADLIDGLRAVTTMLLSVIVTTEPGARAVIRRRPVIETGRPEDFAARGALEMVLHTHDICTGLGIRFVPPHDLCQRLRDHTQNWPSPVTRERIAVQSRPTTDAWSDLLERSGRARLLDERSG